MKNSTAPRPERGHVVDALTMFPLFLGMLFASPVAGQHFQIRDNPQGGDCVGQMIGAWNPASKTCTLTASLTGSISIEDDDVTLDGRGLQLRRGPRTRGVGVTIQNRQKVVVRRLLVHGFDQGIVVRGGSNNFVEECSITGPRVTRHGIVLEDTFRSQVRNNNRVSSCTDVGIWIRWSHRCNVTKNNLFQNHIGILLTGANFNLLDGNQVSGSGGLLGMGVEIIDGNDNEISRNTIRRNTLAGISIDQGNGNAIFLNHILDNVRSGLTHTVGTNNRFFCNNIQGHNLGVVMWAAPNRVWWNNFYASDDGQDLIGGNSFNENRPTGGNFWKRHAPNCVDANGDGFCDAPFAFPGNQDNLPHVKPIPWVTSPEICFKTAFTFRQDQSRWWHESIIQMVKHLVKAISSGNAKGVTDYLSKDVSLIVDDGAIEGREAVLTKLDERWKCGKAKPQIIALGEPSAEPTITEIGIGGCDLGAMRLLVVSRFDGEENTRRIELLILSEKDGARGL